MKFLPISVGGEDDMTRTWWRALHGAELWCTHSTSERYRVFFCSIQHFIIISHRSTTTATAAHAINSNSPDKAQQQRDIRERIYIFPFVIKFILKANIFLFFFYICSPSSSNFEMLTINEWAEEFFLSTWTGRKTAEKTFFSSPEAMWELNLVGNSIYSALDLLCLSCLPPTPAAAANTLPSCSGGGDGCVSERDRRASHTKN